MGKRFMSFYKFMLRYPHQLPDRIALAAELKRLAPDHKEVKEIDSMMDMMLIARILKDEQAINAVSGSLWCEYCAACGRPLEE